MMASTCKTYRSTSFIVVELIPDDLQGVVDWYIGEKTNNVKAEEGI
jgi:hypothetical protein